jgi:hypothetical protein
MNENKKGGRIRLIEIDQLLKNKYKNETLLVNVSNSTVKILLKTV